MSMNTINEWVRGSVTLRAIVIGILALLLLIPVAMVRSVIDERQMNRATAIADIEQKWGGAQVIAGPVLSVPYTETRLNEKGERVTSTLHAHFLPKELLVDGKVTPEIRSRGIFDAAVYSSVVAFSGTFDRPDVVALGIDPQRIQWDKATLSVGIPDLRGLREGVPVMWDGSTLSFTPGVPTDDVLRQTGAVRTNVSYDKEVMMNIPIESVSVGGRASGLSVRVPSLMLSSLSEHSFSFTLALDGSQTLQIVPLGRTTDVRVTSPWKTPSFSGAFLPDERQVNDAGFSASWRVLDLNRNYPQSWVGSAYDVYGSAFGVDFMVPVDEYQKSTRSAKYALLIIALTFLVFFSFETFNKKRIHPIQYVLVGLALVLFYSLLVGFSEIVGFNYAYLISSVATIGLIVMYSHAVLCDTKAVRVQGSILVFLYLFVYMILQLEDYAFLAGSIGLFVILSVIMYMSRRVDWYRINK